MVDTPSTPIVSNRPWMSTKLKVLLVTAILLVLGYRIVVGAIDAKLRAARDEWTGDQPLEVSAYLPPPDLPTDAVNATDYLEAAGLIAEGQEQVYLVGRGDSPSELREVLTRFRRLEHEVSRPDSADLDAFRVAVERHAFALDILDQGLDTATAARYVTDYSIAPHDIVIPNLLLRLRLGSLLRARAELAIAEGRDADGWRDATRIFQLAHWTTDDIPTLINTLIGRAVAHQGALLTQALLSEAPGTAADRAPVGEWANQTDVVNTINGMLAAERAIAFARIADPDAEWRNTEASSHGRIAGWLDGWRPWRKLNAALYLESASPGFATCATPSHQVTTEQRDLSQHFPPSWAAPAHHALFDCIDVGHKRDLWLTDQHHLTMALALEDTREATGEYPEALTDRTIDPFSGKPHHYRRTSEGYVLYSVSINRKDDGGVPPSLRKHGTSPFIEGDVVWRVASRG